MALSAVCSHCRSISSWVVGWSDCDVGLGEIGEFGSVEGDELMCGNAGKEGCVLGDLDWVFVVVSIAASGFSGEAVGLARFVAFGVIFASVRGWCCRGGIHPQRWCGR
jgi:hypothetical protein